MRHEFDHNPTAQEVFDAACTYFATSPGPSTIASTRTGTGNECVYRSPNGRVCIAGYFLPDSAYIPDMDNPNKFDDGSTVKALVRHYGDRLPAWWKEHVSLLKALQNLAHDDESNWRSGPDGYAWHRSNVAHALRSIADDFSIQDLSAIDVVYKPVWVEVEA